MPCQGSRTPVAGLNYPIPTPWTFLSMERIRGTAGKNRNRLTKKRGNQSVTNRNQLKPKVADGKFYKTDVADREQLLRLIQSIPSPRTPVVSDWRLNE